MSQSPLLTVQPTGTWCNGVAIVPIDYMAHPYLPKGPMMTPLAYPVQEQYVPHSRGAWFIEGAPKPVWYMRKQVKMLTKY